MRPRLFRRARERLTLITLGAMVLTVAQTMAPVSVPTARAHQLELPDPRPQPGRPPAVAMDAPDGAPGLVAPGAPAPNVVAPKEEGRPRPGSANKVVKKSFDDVAALESASGVKVVENEDGLFAYDSVDSEGRRHRTALFDDQTVSGVPVIAFAFLDEAEILAVEKAC